MSDKDDQEVSITLGQLLGQSKVFFIGFVLGLVIAYLLRIRFFSAIVLAILVGTGCFFAFLPSTDKDNYEQYFIVTKVISLIIYLDLIIVIVYLIFKILTDRV